MEAVEYLKLKARICEEGCRKCPLNEEVNKSKAFGSCSDLEDASPEKATAIVKKWGEQHAVYTNQNKFEEMEKAFNKNATRCDEKVIATFCETFNNCDQCKKWWRSEYKEVKE